MVKTKILLSVVIVLIIGVVAAGYQITNNAPNIWKPTNPQEEPDQSSQITTKSQSESTTGSGGSQSQSGGTYVKISSTQAKSIASQSINLPRATAGTPTLTKINGNKVYVVPIIHDGQTSGEIWIDAQTGKNIGGAGGAPSG